MTSLIYLVALAALGQVNAVVELNCSDNATCIDYMARELVRSVRQQKTVRLFDLFTLEPLHNQERARQARGLDPLTRMMKSYAISFDWNDFTFRFSNPDDEKQTLDLELFESRSTKDVTEDLPKKSKSKVEEEVVEDIRKPKGHIKRRRHKRKVLQAVFPMLFGMKSAGAAIFGLAVVTVLTLKAFFASKMALGITVYMAMKKFYESYGSGVGLQNHPYLYSQYPIDFPSATSNAYSVSGVSPQFASPEMYGPTALAANSHTHEMIQHSDASAQQSQQAPTVLVNSTRASERWDGKSKLLRLLEPMFEKIRSVVDPIATIFYDAMPATFRGLNSDVSTAKNAEQNILAEEGTKKPREILVPQPRHIAQRKMFRKGSRYGPKKYTELKLDLNRLKQNKDLPDYVKTKKYKYNYPQTFYYPRVKYFVNPSHIVKPNNSRLMPYRKISAQENTLQVENMIQLQNTTTEWKPLVVFHPILDFDNETIPTGDFNSIRRKRTRRSLDTVPDKKKKKVTTTEGTKVKNKINNKKKNGLLQMLMDPLTDLVERAEKYAKVTIKNSLKSEEPPIYYSTAYSLLMQCLDVIDGLIEVHNDLYDYLFPDERKKPKIKIKKPNKANIFKPHQHDHDHDHGHDHDHDNDRRNVTEVNILKPHQHGHDHKQQQQQEQQLTSTEEE